MIERADQLILNYVSKAADAAHGVLRPEQRLDFTRRLRARIEEERAGSQNARDVVKVLARFGDPVALVEREVRRLAAASAPPPPGPGAGTDGVTAAFPKVVDDPALPPGVAHYRRVARAQLSRRPRGLPFAGLRRAAMAGANPMATGGRDARTVVKEHPREAAALVILVVAALLVPFDLPAVAIFRVPVIAWGAGAALVMFSETWALRDRLIGIGAPMLGYTAGGVVVGDLRVGDRPGLQAFVLEFFNASGIMFMIGTGAGVCWLFLRLLDRG
ncbi:hypothetical protein [Nonomuraea sp. SBT364]|uniref:hypothetical protein n=1 Tax=Nonomuraea sp. SBT364 TaxID=1580530 RepID=UPI00066A4680|nr:hypothetical protein [Nonomuraea sp. SBT364]